MSLADPITVNHPHGGKPTIENGVRITHRFSDGTEALYIHLNETTGTALALLYEITDLARDGPP